MRKLLLLFLTALLMPIMASAQEFTVSGNIIDNLKLEVVGASIMEKGTKNGTISDFDGNYSINLQDKNATLVISFIGYKTQEVNVNGRGTVNVVLHEDSEMLDEVVVTGYGGTQLRTKVTNSIAKVKEENLTVGLFSNPAQALSGAVSGLKVVQSSGSPGAAPTLVLRGGTNLDGTGSPLILVDGQLRSSLSDINPEDIESMEVLKDAGATALYGARASNGVVLVTTKTGKSGHREINLKAKFGWNYINNPYEFLGAKDYINVMRTAYANTAWAPKSNLTGATPMGTGNVLGERMVWNIMGKTADNAYLLQRGWMEMPDPLDPTKSILYRDTNPADYNINNPSFSQDYNVNMKGGNDRGNYYAGIGYNHQEGLPINTFYKRYSFVLNANYKIQDWLQSTSNFNFNRANWRNMPGSQGSEVNYFGRIMSLPSTVRFTDEDGNATLGPNAGDGNQSYQADQWQVDNQSDKFTMIQSFQVNFMKSLWLNATANWYYSSGYYESFTKDYENTIGSWVTSRNTSAQYERDFAQTYNLVLNFNETFAGKHNVTAMAGMEYYDNYNRGFKAAGSGAPTDDFGDLGLTDTGEGKRTIDSWHTRYRILSFFGRANYDYDNKYLLSFVLRRDGYSSLLGKNRWGNFPGVSAGWIFGNESFVKEKLPFLSFGKLRTSFGLNGNASGIGAYTLQGSYNGQQYNGNMGYLIGTLPNPSLRWEKTRTFEVGLDMSFIENRLNTNFTFYDRLTSDKYASLSLPSTTGFSSVTNNNGKFRNRGLEMELSARIIDKKDWTWNMSANIAYNKNIVVSLPDNGLLRNMQSAAQIYKGHGSNETIWVGGYQEGYEPGVLVVYKADGIYKSWDEIPGNLVVKTGNAQGKYQYGPDAWAALTDAERSKGIQIKPGDVKWADINGDGEIDAFDRIVAGNTTPRWIGGFNTSLKWKNLMLYARFDFALKYWIYDTTTPWFLGCMQGTYNTTTDVFNTWSETNPNAKYPRYDYADQLGAGNFNRNSTLFAYKGNYLAIREISLQYTLPKEWANKMYCQNLNVSVTGQNLGYITKAPVATPEVSSAGSGYALPRTCLLGINLTF